MPLLHLCGGNAIRVCPELPPTPPHPGPWGRIPWAPETVAAARPAASGLQPQGVALLFSQPGFLSRHLEWSTGFSSPSLPASSRQTHTVQCPVAASASPGRHPRRSGWIRGLRLRDCRMKGPGWGWEEVKMITPLRVSSALASCLFRNSHKHRPLPSHTWKAGLSRQHLVDPSILSFMGPHGPQELAVEKKPLYWNWLWGDANRASSLQSPVPQLRLSLGGRSSHRRRS